MLIASVALPQRSGSWALAKGPLVCPPAPPVPAPALIDVWPLTTTIRQHASHRFQSKPQSGQKASRCIRTQERFKTHISCVSINLHLHLLHVFASKARSPQDFCDRIPLHRQPFRKFLHQKRFFTSKNLQKSFAPETFYTK